MAGLQVVLDAGNFDGDVRKALTTGCSVEISGQMLPHPKHGVEQCEMHGDHVQLVGGCDATDYPLQKKFHSLDFLRQSGIIHLRPRTNTIGAAARVGKCTWRVNACTVR